MNDQDPKPGRRRFENILTGELAPDQVASIDVNLLVVSPSSFRASAPSASEPIPNPHPLLTYQGHLVVGRSSTFDRVEALDEKLWAKWHGRNDAPPFVRVLIRAMREGREKYEESFERFSKGAEAVEFANLDCARIDEELTVLCQMLEASL